MTLIRFLSSVLLLTGFPLQPAHALNQWPDKYDYLEEITFAGTTTRDNGINLLIPRCDTADRSGTGTQATSSWLRTAYHDMATYNAAAGIGGMDASIMFETDRAENVGKAFQDTFNDFLEFYGKDVSMADLIAIGAAMAVHVCGGNMLPIRFGRIDASGPGDPGVPEPQQTTQEFVDIFARSGFDTADMIKMVACGHTIGGVHGIDFPNITGNASSENHVKFDSTGNTFDEKIATDFFNENVPNPLVSGPSETNSDTRVFGTDGNVTIRAMMDPKYFQDSCKDILTRMIDTVPKDVQLTDVVVPYDVKPIKPQLTLLMNGSFELTGSIRVKTTGLDNGKNLSVSLSYSDRAGQPQEDVIETVWGISGGIVDMFEYYDFSTIIPPAGISSFQVAIKFSDPDNIIVYDNGGSGFPVQDEILFIAEQSCLVPRTGTLTVVAAVRNDLLPGSIPTLEVIDKVGRSGTIVPGLFPASVSMTELKKTQSTNYTLFTSSYTLDTNGAPFLAEFAPAMDDSTEQYRKVLMFLLSGPCKSTDGW